MESFGNGVISMDDLLDFSSDIGEECEEDDELCCEKTKMPPSSFSLLRSCPLTEFVEEELEWISNKDAFPMVETFVDIIPNKPTSTTTSTTTTTTTPNHHHHSNHHLMAVLENSSTSSSINSITSSSGSSCSAVSALISTKVPRKARTRTAPRRRRPDMSGLQWQCWPRQPARKVKVNRSSTLGRKCVHCLSEKTPQWRAGPLGPKTLCNACGVRYKSGRLVPEYRPASSPTFSSLLHSNSHRKIVEMRKQKMMVGCENGVGGEIS